VERFLFASSSSVYGRTNRLPFSEDDRIDRPYSPYAATKVAGEALCHTYHHLYGMQVLCLRFFTAYGPRQRPDLAIHKFARLMAAGMPIPVYGDGSARRDYTYIDDILDGVVQALEYDGSGFEVINLGEARTTTVLELVALLEAAMGKRAIIEERPWSPGDMPGTWADIGKARQLLGYDPQVPIEEGICKFVEWFARLAPERV
jgi:UDP-glucuronate 4-epimerase